jgi:hypothetical protein
MFLATHTTIYYAHPAKPRALPSSAAAFWCSEALGNNVSASSLHLYLGLEFDLQ